MATYAIKLSDIPRTPVTENLVEAYSDLFDDPESADVVFVVTPHHSSQAGKRPRQRRIHALKVLLKRRSDYFDAMFTSGFRESVTPGPPHKPSGAAEHAAGNLSHDGQDDDDEVEDGIWNDSDYEEEPRAFTLSSSEEDGAQRRAGDHALGAKVAMRRNGHGQTEVAVVDASYRTFRAMLYFLYTERISFLPLEARLDRALPAPTVRAPAHGSKGGEASATAMYALADKMGLEHLKIRASNFIRNALSIQNISHQAFGSFPQQYEGFKKLEIAFLLDNWEAVRFTDGFKAVMKAPHRYPGFEEIFEHIHSSLAYYADEGQVESLRREW